MRYTILSVFQELADVVTRDYAAFEHMNTQTAAPFLSLGSFLDTSGQLEDEQLIDLANLYLSAAGTKKISLSMSGYKYTNRGFSVRGTGSELYVDEVFGEERLSPGDRILSLFGKKPEIFRSQSLMANHVLPISDRDDWHSILNHTAFCHVRHANGSEEKINLRSFIESPQELTYYRILHSNVLYFRTVCLDGSEENMVALNGFMVHAMRSNRIIIDLRRCRGGDAESFSCLTALLPITEQPHPAEHDIYYSHENCDVWELNLSAISKTNPEYADIIGELLSELSLKRGSGFVPGESDTYVCPDETIPRNRRIVLLTDFRTADEAESFAACAKGLEGVTIIGRATSGNYNLSHEIRKNLGFGCSVSYPIGISRESRLIGLNGVEPDININWSPAEITTDVLLEHALDIIYGNK